MTEHTAYGLGDETMGQEYKDALAVVRAIESFIEAKIDDALQLNGVDTADARDDLLKKLTAALS